MPALKRKAQLELVPTKACARCGQPASSDVWGFDVCGPCRADWYADEALGELAAVTSRMSLEDSCRAWTEATAAWAKREVRHA